jgi:superfamily II DNA or RNA helicase
LSATPGDTWSDYIPVFLANGFYRNRTEFMQEHAVYSRFSKYPKIERYINTGRLIRYRNQLLVDMDFKRQTVSHHEDVNVRYDISMYKDIGKKRWNPYTNEPIVNAAELCYLWRKVVNSDESRQVALLEIFEKHPRIIVFYNFDYELEILKSLHYGPDVAQGEWNGHAHQAVPTSERWVYFVQYTAGCEGWNCITTDTIVFYSQNYSYKVMHQASGRIDRLNTPFKDLYYYHLKTRSGIDLAISRALKDKKNFNEGKYVNW